MISVFGVGLRVTGLTALLGFSAAIGGFFAGLLFSKDPLSVKIDASFGSVRDLAPFFFIFVGFSIDLGCWPDRLGRC
jgi:Kef-type K+ transport system membrane component KefB